MSNDEIGKLQGVLRTVLNQPDLVVSRTLNAADVPQWDSFAHVNLIIAVEEEFKIRFSPGEIGTMKNAGDLIDRIDEKRGKA